MCQRYTLSLFALAAVLLSCQPDDSHVAACDLPDADGGFLNADSSVVAYPHLARAAVISEDVYTGWIVVRPGGTIPVHSHGVEHEIAFITCGGGERSLDGDVIRIGEGDVMHALPGQPHGVTAGPAGLVAVQIYRPGAPGLRFYDWTPMEGDR